MESTVKDGKKQMINFINNDVISDLNQMSGLNDITVSEITFEKCYELTDSAQYDRKVTLTSEEIEKYSGVRSADNKEIENLLKIFRAIYSQRDKYGRECYHYIFGKNEIGFNFLLSEYYSTIIINGSNSNIYEYGVGSDYEHLYLNSMVLYEKLGDNYGKRSNSDNNINNEYTGSYDATLEYGSENVLICFSVDTMSRFFKAINNKNQGTVDEMLINGEIGFTTKGTKCNIIETGISRYKVLILDGPYKGNEVWVISESVNKK